MTFSRSYSYKFKELEINKRPNLTSAPVSILSHPTDTSPLYPAPPSIILARTCSNRGNQVQMALPHRPEPLQVFHWNGTHARRTAPAFWSEWTNDDVALVHNAMRVDWWERGRGRGCRDLYPVRPLWWCTGVRVGTGSEVAGWARGG